MIYHELIIIGGGASGLMAAIVAKDYGIDVAIVDGSDRVGKKILTTGNGRCNISNNSIQYPFVNYHSNVDNFFIPTLNSFSVEQTKNLFLSLGLPITELENHKLYPQSLQASSVVDILRLNLEERNIPTYMNCKVKSIHRKKNFILSTNNDDFSEFSCGKVLMCCGGKSATKTGSDGTAYKLCEEFGHKLIKPLPGIVQLKLDYPHLKALSGIKFDGKVTVYGNNKVLRQEVGEVLFTDYGISGPPILQISSTVSRAFRNGQKVTLDVDMMPFKDTETVENELYTHLALFSTRSISNALIGVINKKLIPTLLKDCGIFNIHTPCCELEWKNQSDLISRLKSWKFTCSGTKEFQGAQVTVGGIDTSDINPDTLESKLVPGMYFAGEFMDVDGDCGGFNLQWAWSSGFFAATSIKNALNK
ncbi:MAG: NAD(P)/FAD-dependent oxidoreductase [Clostridium sp.]|uniref:NAD(P)/FAD-dependent oxidoreductase n=1 Tax=Clostridium sp. TaxID=1506 RepID=UPI003F2BC704